MSGLGGRRDTTSTTEFIERVFAFVTICAFIEQTKSAVNAKIHVVFCLVFVFARFFNVELSVATRAYTVRDFFYGGFVLNQLAFLGFGKALPGVAVLQK